MTPASRLDEFLAPEIRNRIEQDYYARINQQSQLDEALKDPEFLKNPSKHMALFADHGVVHVRDVAQQTLQVLDTVHGVLIPARDPARFAWMQRYGVLLAYLHDIGMVNPAPFGRAMHPEFSSQAVFGTGFDAIIAELLSVEDGLGKRLSLLHADGTLKCPTDVVVREMAAMAICHSKTKIPVDLLNDPRSLRPVMRSVLTNDLSCLHGEQKARNARRALAAAEQASAHSAETDYLRRRLREAEAELQREEQVERTSAIARLELPRLYQDFVRDGFAWLETDDPEALHLLEDVIDSLRVLRCADALRQRGTALKTSGNYEVFVDQRSANAIYALRHGREQLYLLEVPDRISAGEANLASSELDQDGNLRITFHRGMFSNREIIDYAAGNAALVIDDIQSDALGSFSRPAGPDSKILRAISNAEIHIEDVDDNPEFAALVCLALQRLNPSLAAQPRVVSSLQANSLLERAHYLRGHQIDWPPEQRQDLLRKIAQAGHRTENIDLIAGFHEVREIRLQAGEILIEAGAPAGIVYIPQDEGLRGIPLGGYEDFAVTAWTPVGVTGVVRGGVRNATVIASRDVALLAIPKAIYLANWHRTYDAAAFAALFAREPAGSPA